MTCVHRWRLEDQTAFNAPGTCRLCGAVKTFSGGEAQLDFARLAPLSRKGWKKNGESAPETGIRFRDMIGFSDGIAR